LVSRLFAAFPPPVLKAMISSRQLECFRAVARELHSAKAPAVDALKAADLAAHVERVIASDAVRAYKPATRVYATAVEQLGVRAAEIVMVSAH